MNDSPLSPPKILVQHAPPRFLVLVCFVKDQMGSAWWGRITNSSLHPSQHTLRLLHYGPCRYHEHNRYSWSHPVPPNSYQPKSRLSPPPPRESWHALQTKTEAARSAVNSQNYYKHSYCSFFLFYFHLLLFCQFHNKRTWWWWWIGSDQSRLSPESSTARIRRLRQWYGQGGLKSLYRVFGSKPVCKCDP